MKSYIDFSRESSKKDKEKILEFYKRNPSRHEKANQAFLARSDSLYILSETKSKNCSNWEIKNNCTIDDLIFEIAKNNVLEVVIFKNKNKDLNLKVRNEETLELESHCPILADNFPSLETLENEGKKRNKIRHISVIKHKQQESLIIKIFNDSEYQKNQNQKIHEKEPNSQHNHSSSEIIKLASYDKIQNLLKTGVLKEDIDFTVKNNKRIWNDNAIQKIKDICVITEEEQQEFEDLFVYCSSIEGISDYKLSQLMAKVMNRKHRAIYAFLYSFFKKRINKARMIEYREGFLKIKEQHEKGLLKI